MMPTLDYSIIIVGGGPAGLAAALHIAERAPQLARDLLIIEAKEYPRPKLCGGGITVHGEEQLERLGLHLDVPSFTVDKLVFRLGSQDFNIPFKRAMRVIQREEFDAAIAQAVQDCGLRMNTSERVQEIHRDENGVTLITDKATYRTKVIIAADGANSTVRRKLNFASSESTARLMRVMTPIDIEKTPAWDERVAVFDFSPVKRGVQGYAWDFPCYVDGVPYMNRGIFDSQIAPRRTDLPHGNLKTVFSDWLAERDVDLGQVQLKGHPVRWFNREAEVSQPHVLLTGDAAGVDALFAEGISYAMEYGGIVAEQVSRAFENDDFSFVGYRDAILKHRLGILLLRRAAIARALYRYRLPPFWWIFWRMAGFAWPAMQQSIGAWMALLPARAR